MQVYQTPMSIQTFLMKKMLGQKLKDVPEADQQKIFAALEKNPELFKNIAAEVQAKMKDGKGQMLAVMEIVQKYQGDLQQVMK